MLKLTQRFLGVGLLLAAGGTAGGFLGGWALYHSLSAPPGAQPSTLEFILTIVMPHVALLLGIGLLVFGVLLIAKGILFHREQARLSAVLTQRTSGLRKPRPS